MEPNQVEAQLENFQYFSENEENKENEKLEEELKETQEKETQENEDEEEEGNEEEGEEEEEKYAPEREKQDHEDIDSDIEDILQETRSKMSADARQVIREIIDKGKEKKVAKRKYRPRVKADSNVNVRPKRDPKSSRKALENAHGKKKVEKNEKDEKGKQKKRESQKGKGKGSNISPPGFNLNISQ